jgi:hypothetical protein
MPSRTDDADGLEVRVISLRDDSLGLREMSTVFPGAQRTVDVAELYRSEMISEVAFDSIMHGRKWHRELPQLGGVGLMQANRLALARADGPILLCEDDCKVLEPKRLKSEVRALLHAHVYDVAVFGARLILGKNDKLRQIDGIPGWYEISGGEGCQFVHMHCCMYSRTGRAKVWRLFDRAQTSQIDFLLSAHAEAGELRLALQLENPSVVQNYHQSSVQQDRMCLLCDLSPINVRRVTLYTVIAAVCCALLVLVVCAVRPWEGGRIRNPRPR